MIYINGIELVPFEFKELLLNLAMRLQDLVDAEAGKLKSLIRKFMSTLFLRRLSPYIRFNLESQSQKVEVQLPVRSWPQSKKDEDIKVIMIEKAK